MKATLDHDVDPLEIAALTILLGDPEVRTAFERLTEAGSLHLRTNPAAENLSWDGPALPTDADLEIDAAVRLLMSRGYVASINRARRGDYVVYASDKARAVRTLYDQLPEHREASSQQPNSASP